MDVAKMIQALKEHHDYGKMGMIASHLGVVRETSVNGEKIRGIEVTFDKKLIQQIINETRDIEGIVQVSVQVSEGRLEVGDEIMAMVVGGDTREHVFPALITAVNRIKAEATTKQEFF